MKRIVGFVILFFMIFSFSMVFGCTCCNDEDCTIQMGLCASITVCEYEQQTGPNPEVNDWFRIPAPKPNGKWMETTGHVTIDANHVVDTNQIPQLISTGIFDQSYYTASGTHHETVGTEEFYYLLGNHTRFKIACNYKPYIQLTVPNKLLNGSNMIDVVHVELIRNLLSTGNDGVFGPILPVDGLTESFHFGNPTVASGVDVSQCAIGGWDTNRYGIYFVIKISEKWWQYPQGTYKNTLTLTLNPSP